MTAEGAAPDMRSLVEQHRIVAILRGVPVRQAPTLAEHLYRAGIRLLEVSFSDEQGPEVLDILHGALDGALLLGAGTVTTLERATAARQAGARFVLTPHLVPEVNAYAVSHGLGLISGAMTPSEVQTARQQGSEVVKLFPAGDLGSGYLRSLLGPYPDLSVLVVGNIGQHNLGEFIRAGALGAGIGSYLTRTDWNTPDYGELARRAPHLLAAFDSGGR